MESAIKTLFQVRSMPVAAGAYLLGVMLMQQCSQLPDQRWIWLMLAPLLISVWVPLTRFFCIIALGFVSAWLVAANILAFSLPAELEGVDLVVEGEIASIPQNNDERLRFEFIPAHMTYNGHSYATPGKILLRWYGRQRPRLNVGEVWRLKVRLKRPHGTMNPGGFDYERWLFRHHLRAVGYVRDDPVNQALPHKNKIYLIDRVRQRMGEAIGNRLSAQPNAGIIVALAIGEQNNIDRSQWDVLLRTGINHLVAISGLHVELMAILLYFCVRHLWLRLGDLALRWSAQKAAVLAGCAGATFYSALAGFSIPTQRTLIMLVVVMAGVLMQRRFSASHILALALLVVLMFDPLAVMEPGFWLSFAAVAIILMGMRGRLEADSWWWKWGRVHVLVVIGLAPLTLVMFNRLALISPLANFIAVPWISFIVVPLTLAGSMLILIWPDPGGWILWLAAACLDLLWLLLELLAGLESAQWMQHTPPLWTMLPGLFGILLLLAPRGLPFRWLGWVLLLPMFCIAPPRPAHGEAWFTLLDVGQGLASVVRTAHHTLVFDTGPRHSENFDAGDSVVVPFLRETGITHIDMLVISHGDADHAGGARSVLRQMPSKRLLSSVPQRLHWQHGEVESCIQGQTWQWDGVAFEMLYPYSNLLGGRKPGNDSSCVLRVQTAAASVLMTGDIEKRSERLLLEQAGQRLKSDILVVPHHGSNTSSTQPFLAAVRPAYAVFPVGYRNRFHFPRPEVMQRYQDANITLYESARHGAITFHLGDRPLLGPETFRQVARRYWHIVP